MANKEKSKTKFTVYYKLYHEEYGKQVVNYMGNSFTCYAENKKQAQESFLNLLGKKKFKIDAIEQAPQNKKVDSKLF